MISITFGLGNMSGGGFFPESDFSISLQEDEISVNAESPSLTLVVEEDIITMEVE